MGIAAIMLPALATAVVASREGRAQEARRMQAAALMREANEAVRVVSEKGWEQFAINGTYYPMISGGSWSLVSGTQAVEGFTRYIVISDAQRNAGGALVGSGGTVDSSTKKATVTVSWSQPLSGNLSNEAYFHRYEGNTAWTQTTQADFNAGTRSNTVVTATGGGGVELASAGGPAHVQNAGSVLDTSSTIITQAFSTSVTGGNLIVAAISWDTASSTTVTCSDNQSNTYVTVTNTNDTSNSQALAICYAINVAGGATTVTATFGAASVTKRIAVHEYSGVTTVSPVDVSSTNVANNTTAVDNVTSNAATTTVAGDLLFGAVMETAPGGATITAGTGYTQRRVVTGELATQDRIQAAAGSVASTQTFSTNGLRYVAQMVAFKAAGTATAWAPPNILGSADTAGAEDALDVFVSGNYAYVADATILRIYDITDPDTPTLTGSYTAAGNINGVYVSGNFAYIATASTSSEFRVVNVTNKASPTQAATMDVTGTAAGNAIYVDGTYAYLARANSTTSGTNEFVIINITTPTSPTLSGSLNMSNAANSVYVSGNFAYVATSITSAELTIINITTKTAPASAGTYDASGTSIAADVFGVGTTIYLGKANNTSGAEFFILNAATPTSVSLVGSYEAGANINGVYVSGTNAFLATAITNAQFRVLNIATPSSPSLLGSLNLAAVSNDVMFSGTSAFVASASDTRELTILRSAPSTGAIGYVASGTFDSSTLDTSNSVAYNYITFSVTEPASTDVRLQIAVNNDNATWNYVGPDGTGSTYYSSATAVRLSTTGRYVRYRATLTGPGTSTPALSDVTVNYSP